MNVRIASVGEPMAEISADGAGFHVGFAGDSLNTAIYCKRALGDAGEVTYVTRLGFDPLSDALCAFAEAEGLSTSAIERDADNQVGIYSIAVDEVGERSFHYWRSQSAARQMFRRPDGAQLVALCAADIVYVSGISIAILSPGARTILRDELARQRSAGTIRVAFDSNYRPGLWEDAATARAVIESFWRIADIALPSVDDEMALFGDADSAAVVERLEGWGCGLGALKQGNAGPRAIGRPTEPARFEPADKVVDSTAAGDSFNGAFLAAIATGSSLEDAMQAGHAMARRVVGHRGAILPRDI